MENKQELVKLSNFKKEEIGDKEENVKLKLIVPLLELLGHKKENLEFEHKTSSGGKYMDIFIKNVPPDCKVIIDTKNYTENLDDHIDQIKNYAFSESALLTVIANGSELRIYSPLRGVAFEKSLLYSFQREKFKNEIVFKILSDLLHIDNLKNKNVLKKIEEREREIKNAMASEDELKNNFEQTVEGIESDIESKEEEIEVLQKEKEKLIDDLKIKTINIWEELGLPLNFPFMHSQTNFTGEKGIHTNLESGRAPKKRKVQLRELIDAGLLRDKQKLIFYNNGRMFNEEQAEIIPLSNKLKYKQDGKIYSISELAKILLHKHKFRNDDRGVAGPKHWKTEDGKWLNDLNDQVRMHSGESK